MMVLLLMLSRMMEYTPAITSLEISSQGTPDTPWCARLQEPILLQWSTQPPQNRETIGSKEGLFHLTPALQLHCAVAVWQQRHVVFNNTYTHSF